ncbi:MAG: hypothetical protein K2X82_01970 [Gemmataceae bacterium]|nr:hypothetical protein [Gemmataceae bacterium]
MGKIITILGGCLVAAGGVGYGVYTYHHGGGCPLSGCGAKVSATAPCCAEPDACPLAVGTSAGDEGGCCPLAAAAKATSPVSASAGDDGCCDLTATKCPAPAASGAGLQAVAGTALAAGGK